MVLQQLPTMSYSQCGHDNCHCGMLHSLSKSSRLSLRFLTRLGRRHCKGQLGISLLASSDIIWACKDYLYLHLNINHMEVVWYYALAAHCLQHMCAHRHVATLIQWSQAYTPLSRCLRFSLVLLVLWCRIRTIFDASGRVDVLCCATSTCLNQDTQLMERWPPTQAQIILMICHVIGSMTTLPGLARVGLD